MASGALKVILALCITLLALVAFFVFFIIFKDLVIEDRSDKRDRDRKNDFDKHRHEDDINGGCPYEKSMGNGYCEDFSNIPLCNFDGGDCCGPSVAKNLCLDCICYDESGVHHL